MQSALANPEPVSEYLQNEQKEERIAGPFPKALVRNIHLSRFGVIPKRHQPGKWRLILDLSHPTGYSVNDGIAKELSTLSVDDAARIISDLGPGTCWPRLILPMRTVTYRFIPQIGICLAWSGRARFTWTQHYHSVSVQRLNSSQLSQTHWNGYSPNTACLLACTTWMIS